jgi:hypothetical protein
MLLVKDAEPPRSKTAERAPQARHGRASASIARDSLVSPAAIALTFC